MVDPSISDRGISTSLSRSVSAPSLLLLCYVGAELLPKLVQLQTHTKELISSNRRPPRAPIPITPALVAPPPALDVLPLQAPQMEPLDPASLSRAIDHHVAPISPHRPLAISEPLTSPLSMLVGAPQTHYNLCSNSATSLPHQQKHSRYPPHPQRTPVPAAYAPSTPPRSPTPPPGARNTPGPAASPSAPRDQATRLAPSA